MINKINFCQPRGWLNTVLRLIAGSLPVFSISSFNLFSFYNSIEGIIQTSFRHFIIKITITWLINYNKTQTIIFNFFI